MDTTTFIVERVTGQEETSATFKSFTNKVVGRGLLIPENNQVFFGYRESHGGAVKLLVTVGTVRPALTPSPSASTSDCLQAPVTECTAVKQSDDDSVNHFCQELRKIDINNSGSSIGEGSILPAFSPEGHENFLHDECHVIEYLFTDPYYRRSGYGKSVLTAMQDYCVSQNPDSCFRLWAASKARSFFRSNGYKQLSNKPSECRHSVMIFQHLYPMEKLDSSQNYPTTATGQNKKRYRNRRKPKNKTSQPRPMYGPG